MRIKKFNIYCLHLPLVHPFQTSFGRTTIQQTLIIEIVADGVVGFGECPAGSKPGYSYETVDTAFYVIKNFIAPAIKLKQIMHPSEVVEMFSFIRGHNMAKAGVEMALWDAYAKINGLPLWKLLGGKGKKIPTGISLGIQENVERLFARISEAIEKGYRRIKIKIEPGWDVNIVSEIRKEFGKINLMVDANAAYSLKDIKHLKRLDKFGLMMIEQPLDYDDIIDHAKLQSHLKTPVCLDESIKSPQDARKSIEIGACRVINIKQARVGGTTNAIAVHDICAKVKIPVWCGGLLESGIGRLHNIALATLKNFTLPGDISASERYYKQDIIDPPVIVDKDGMITIPREPGIGHKVKTGLLKKYARFVKRMY